MVSQQQSREKVGELLRRWRKSRRLSQMELAFAADVSPRHLSFVETGRSTPSSDLLLRLSDALQLSLRHTNTLLVAGGYAPQFNRWTLEHDHTGIMRAALKRMLEQHEPYPAVVTNQSYDILLYNNGFAAFADWLQPDFDLISRYPNTFKMVFAYDGARPYILNWSAFKDMLLKRLYEESATYQNEAITELYAFCEACCRDEDDTELDAVQTTDQDPQLPVGTLTFCKDDIELCFFSTITAFGTPIDVTVQELRIESLFPADTETRAFFQQLAAS